MSNNNDYGDMTTHNPAALRPTTPDERARWGAMLALLSHSGDEYRLEWSNGKPTLCEYMRGRNFSRVADYYILSHDHAEFMVEARNQMVPRLLADLERALYVPGEWRCNQCKFVLTKSILSAFTGDIWPNDDLEAEDCPNCAIPLVRVAWASELREAREFASEQSTKLHDAELALLELAKRLPAEHANWCTSQQDSDGKCNCHYAILYPETPDPVGTVRSTKPKIYLFIGGYWGEDVVGYALAEDGMEVGQHVSSNVEFSKHDLGLTTDWHHADYSKHYPDGYEVEWVDDVESHSGLQAALALKKAGAGESVPTEPSTV